MSAYSQMNAGVGNTNKLVVTTMDLFPRPDLQMSEPGVGLGRQPLLGTGFWRLEGTLVWPQEAGRDRGGSSWIAFSTFLWTKALWGLFQLKDSMCPLIKVAREAPMKNQTRQRTGV